MKKKVLAKSNSILNQFLREIRDIEIQRNRMRFRRNLERMGEIFAYEISKTLSFHKINVETPLGIANVSVPNEQIVLATILRAGLPFHQGLLNYFDNAECAFISAYRLHHKDGSFEIKSHYITCPSVQDKVLILSDPMLASGSSMDHCLKAILDYGTPKSVHLVTAIASTYGLNYISRLYPDMYIWMGDLDEELTAKSYIVPGLGDAGDLCFGSKDGE